MLFFVAPNFVDDAALENLVNALSPRRLPRWNNPGVPVWARPFARERQGSPADLVARVVPTRTLRRRFVFWKPKRSPQGWHADHDGMSWYNAFRSGRGSEPAATAPRHLPMKRCALRGPGNAPAPSEHFAPCDPLVRYVHSGECKFRHRPVRLRESPCQFQGRRSRERRHRWRSGYPAHHF